MKLFKSLGLLAAAILMTVSAGFGVSLGSYNFETSSTWSTGWTLSSTTYVTRWTGTSYKTSTASMRLSYNANAYRTVATTGYNTITVAFKAWGQALTSTEYLVLEYRNTTTGTWVEAKRHTANSTTGTAYTVSLPVTVNNISTFQIRFRVVTSSTTHYAYVDDVVVSGSAPVVSAKAGMGAVPYTGGVTFRVWAPNATSVSVAGVFNNWSTVNNVLVKNTSGYWSVDVPGAVVGQNYKYVINGSTYKKDPYATKQVHSAEASIIYSTGTAPTAISLPYFEDMIVYQLHVGSFYRSATTGVGTFANVATKASYIKGLGVNMVELLPVMEFPGENSWGYNPCDIFAPESSYGGPEGLKSLVTTMHGQGLGLILDIVYNHLGPSDLELWRFDGWYSGSGGGIYFYNDWRGETPWGATRPDYGRGEVRTFLRDNAIFWLKNYNVDGLRWDSTVNIRQKDGTDLPDGWSLLQYINNEINANKGSAISIAEDLQLNTWVTKTTGEGGAGFDSQWDAGFVHKVKGAIETAWDSSRNMGDVAAALQVKYEVKSRQLIYVSSHDEVGNGKQRPPSAIDSANPGSWMAKKRSTIGTAVLMTAPGIPMIFQGEEWCQPGFFDMSVYNNFINWSLATSHSGIVTMYKDLIRVRKTYGSLRYENINTFHVDNNNKLIAYHRWSGTQNMVVIVNFANKTWNSSGGYYIGWPVWKTGHCVFNSDWNGYDAGFGNFGGWDMAPVSGGQDGMAQKALVQIAPYTAQIYDLY